MTHLSLQLLDPALGLCKAIFAGNVEHNHCRSSSPEYRAESQNDNQAVPGYLCAKTPAAFSPVVHGGQTVVSFLPCCVPERQQMTSINSPGCSMHQQCDITRSNVQCHHISNFTFCSGIVFVRKAAPIVDSWTARHRRMQVVTTSSSKAKRYAAFT